MADHKDIKLILVTYQNRSGSTFLVNQLSKSSEVLVCPEADVLVNFFLARPEKKITDSRESLNKLAGEISRDLKFSVWKISIEDIEEVYNAPTYFEIFIQILSLYKNRIKPNARFIVFKAERLIWLFSLLSEQMIKRYDIKFISLIRDCRGVYYSQKITNFPGSQRKMSTNPIRTAKYWTAFVEKTLKLQQIEIVTYEDLMHNLEEVIKKLSQNLSISSFNINDVNGDLMSRLPANHQAIHLHIDKPPQQVFISKWENGLTEKEVYIITKYAYQGLKLMRYPLDYQKCSKVSCDELVYYLAYILKKFKKRLLVLINVRPKFW